jgi:hypothetical protein
MKNALPLLTSTAYFPPAHWLVAGIRQGAWVLEGHENYQKGGWRNRCHIVGPNGQQTLSVPLEKGKHQRMPIQQVRISFRDDWARQHEQSIRTAYGRAPYFEYYAEDIFAILRQPPETLWALNQSLILTVTRLLQLPFVPTITNDFIPADDPAFLRPNTLQETLPLYPQVFTDRHGFTLGLSVLDALFCLGPQLLTTKLT